MTQPAIAPAAVAFASPPLVPAALGRRVGAYLIDGAIAFVITLTVILIGVANPVEVLRVSVREAAGATRSTVRRFLQPMRRKRVIGGGGNAAVRSSQQRCGVAQALKARAARCG